MADGTYLTIFPKFRFKLNMRITRKATLQNRILLRNKKKLQKIQLSFFKNTKFVLLCCGLFFIRIRLTLATFKQF